MRPFVLVGLLVVAAGCGGTDPFGTDQEIQEGSWAFNNVPDGLTLYD